MNRRIFIPCLNKQPKIYNFNYGTVIGAIGCTILGWIISGLLVGLIVGGLGSAFGGWLANQIFKGNVQRFLYWHLPYSRDLIDKNIPDSSNSHEL